MIQLRRNLSLCAIATLAATVTLVSALPFYQHEVRDVSNAHLELAEQNSMFKHVNIVGHLPVVVPALQKRDNLETIEEMAARAFYEELLHSRQNPDEKIVHRSEDALEARGFEIELPRYILPPAVLSIVHMGSRDLWNRRATAAHLPLTPSSAVLINLGSQLTRDVTSIIKSDLEFLGTHEMNQRLPVTGDSVHDHARALWYAASKKRADIDAHVGSIGPRILKDVGRYILTYLNLVITKDVDCAREIETSSDVLGTAIIAPVVPDQ